MTIKNYVWNMVENFKKSHFFLSVAQNNQYDESTVFNENNVVLYLAELEEKPLNLHFKENFGCPSQLRDGCRLRAMALRKVLPTWPSATAKAWEFLDLVA